MQALLENSTYGWGAGMSNQKVKKRHWFIGVLAAVIFFLTVLTGVVYYFFPLEWAEFEHKRELKVAGVETLYEERGVNLVRGLLKPDCQPTSDSPSCACTLLIHGLGDTSLTWRKLLLQDSKTWTRRQRWFAIELPFGDIGGTDGAKPQSEFGAQFQGLRVSNQASRIVEWMKSHQECTTWTVVGNSLGGWIATWVALKADAPLVSRLALLSSAGMKSEFEKPKPTWALQPTVEDLQSFQKKAYARPRDLSPRLWRAAVSKLKQTKMPAWINAQTVEDTIDTYLPSVRQPTLVFWGKQDGVISETVGKEIAQKLRHSIFMSSPDCGHLPQKECTLALHEALESLWRYGSF